MLFTPTGTYRKGAYDVESNSNIVLKTAKGGLYEALIADVLTKNNHRSIHFYRNESGTAEIEFLIEDKDGVIPIEVKAGRSRTKTLDNLLQKDDIVKGYKFANLKIWPL